MRVSVVSVMLRSGCDVAKRLWRSVAFLNGVGRNNHCRAAYKWLKRLFGCRNDARMCPCVSGGQVHVSLSAGRHGVVGRAGRCCRPGGTVLSAGRDGVVGQAGRCCRPGGTVLSAGRDGVVGGVWPRGRCRQSGWMAWLPLRCCRMQRLRVPV